MPFANVNSKSLFYTIDQSDASSPTTTALFIHGLGSSSCFFKTITPALRNAARCIALDTSGSGLSELGNKQSIETIGEDAIGLLDVLKIQEKVVIVGHSMGGIVASYLAAHHPGRVKGVVLIGPVNPSEATVEPFEKRIELVKKDGLEALANTIPTGATATKAEPLQHAFIRSLILGTSPEGYISLCRAIATATQPDYASIKVPMLLLAGAEDKASPLSASKAIFNAYGTQKEKKRLEVLEGVGHWHCVEGPEAVGNHVLAFIESLS